MTKTIDEQFIEYIVKSLVGNPDDVKLERTIDEKGVLLELTVHPDDLGRVIGKRGATAQSLRTLLRALGTKNEARYNLKIVDNGVPKPDRAPREDRDDRGSRDDSSTSYTAASDDISSDDSVSVTDSSDDSTATTSMSSDDDDAWGSSSQTKPEAPSEEESHESVLSKTRKELEDLDDLDI